MKKNRINFQSKILEYSIEKVESKRWIAEFEYKDVHYQLMGVIEQEEFQKIIENLFFVNNSVSFTE